MTGALLLETLTSVALHEVSKRRAIATKSDLPQRRKGAKRCRVFKYFLCAFAPLRERSSKALGAFGAKLCSSCCLVTVFGFAPRGFRRFVGWFVRHRFAGDAILAFDPFPKVDELAPFRTKGTKRIIFPVD